MVLQFAKKCCGKWQKKTLNSKGLYTIFFVKKTLNLKNGLRQNVQPIFFVKKTLNLKNGLRQKVQPNSQTSMLRKARHFYGLRSYTTLVGGGIKGGRDQGRRVVVLGGQF